MEVSTQEVVRGKRMNETQEVVVSVRIDQTDLDEVLRKCERIRDLTKEASSLAGELASGEKTIKINFECDG